MCRGAALISALERVVVEQLVDQVDVREQHAAAAVALEAERVDERLLHLALLDHRDAVRSGGDSSYSFFFRPLHTCALARAFVSTP